MKKIMLAIFGVIALVFAGGAIFYATENATTDYYVKITTDGEKITGKYDSGGDYVDYKYELTGYDKDGKEKVMTFNANKDRPLRKNAYLAVQYITKKDKVKGWNEVSEKDVPKDVLDKLN